LIQIDNKIFPSRSPSKKPPVQAVPTKTAPEKTITDYLRYNEHEQRFMSRTQNLLNNLNIDRSNFFNELGMPVGNTQKRISIKKMLNTNLDIIKEQFRKNGGGAGGSALELLIAEYKSVGVESTIYLDKLYYLLIIVEESISKAQETRVETGDLVKY